MPSPSQTAQLRRELCGTLPQVVSEFPRISKNCFQELADEKLGAILPRAPKQRAKLVRIHAIPSLGRRVYFVEPQHSGVGDWRDH